MGGAVFVDEKVDIEHLDIAEGIDEEIAEIAQRAEVYQAERKRFSFPKLQFSSTKQAIWILAFFASMGGMLSGIDQSLISGANLYLPGDLHLSDNQASLVNSGMPLGAVFGSLLISPCNEWFGRQWSLIIACVFYTIGAGLEAGAINFPMMIAGRLILGAGVGLEGGTVPIYVAESVPSDVRGRIVSLYQFNIALGEVLGYVVAAIFVSVPGNWRFMLGSSLLFSTIMLFGVLMLPESARWLMHKGREEEAYLSWANIRKFDTLQAKAEFLEMRRTAELETHKNNSEEKRKHVWLDFFTKPRCRRALIYANTMIFLGQFTGINAIMYYMSVLMNQIGFDKKQSVFMSLVGGGSLLLGTIPAILYMDKFGRRFWGNVMLPGFFVGLVIIAIAYQFDPITQLATAEGVYLTGMIIYQAFFGSYACLTWVIPSESYPLYLRSYGMTTSSATLFLYSFIVTYNFTRMEDAMTRTGLSLGFYGGIAVIGWVYQLLCMPETKGKTLEELDEVFSMPTGTLIKQNISNMKASFKKIFS